MKAFTAPLCIALFATSLHGLRGAPIVADFEGGDSYKAVDAYVGRAGDGWKGPWKPHLYGVNIFAETKPNPAGKGNSLNVTMTSMPESVDGNKQGAIWRQFEGKGDVDVTKPLQYSFTVQPITQLANNQRIVIFNRIGGPHSGTDAANTWAITALPTEWKIGSEGTGISVDTGKSYTFTIKVNPAANTWVCTVSDGADTYTSGEQTFRAESTSDGTFLHFCGVVNGVDQKVEFGISSIEIAPQN